MANKYFERLDKEAKQAYKIAEEARKKGFDPEEKVSIPIAKDMAERVEGLVSSVAPQIQNSGISKRLRELEKKYGVLDWRVSLIIAEEIANQKYCKFESPLEAIETGIRVGFAYHTLGTVSSPLEGFVGIKERKTKECNTYFALQFSGPIRSAGGTGASVCVLITDYVRMKTGFHTYDPSDDEIKRMSTELYDYHERITNLQYLPSKEEIEFLVKSLSVQVDGDPSEKIEVSNFKDLARIETNNIRNGVCLVLGEGIAQKAEKLWKQLSKWGADFGLTHWNFLKQFIELKKTMHAKGGAPAESSEKPKVLPDYTFIKDLVAGRPILTHPMRSGGFRLRYGRSRTSGMSSDAIHPATMRVLEDYIAIGTQFRTERPGKSTVVSSCDEIDGPIVLLDTGDVLRLDTEKEAIEKKSTIKEILFLGDLLVNYGDFFNRAHTLVPPGYCEEWWVQELEKSIVSMFGSLDLEKVSPLVGISVEALEKLLHRPLRTKVSGNAAIVISEKLMVPLHPRYTYYWSTISKEQLITLYTWLKKSKIEKQGDRIDKVIIPFKEEKRILELLGVPHKLVNKEFVVIEKNEACTMCRSLGIENTSDCEKKIKEVTDSGSDDPLTILNSISNILLRDKAGTFIGARMGRPEKAKLRQLTGSPHVLFPVSDEGGRLRSFQSTLDAGKITAEFPVYYCEKCDREEIAPVCITCKRKTKKRYYCKDCGLIEKKECNHGEAASFRHKEIDIRRYYTDTLKHLNLTLAPDLIKGVRGTSNKDHTPEHLAKGILRAKNNIYVNKDGTVRYDMTQMALTHFKPKEIKASVSKLKELGYEYDIYGNTLERSDQTIEIKPQDIVLPACYESPEQGADKILLKVTQFIDDLLVRLYGLKPFYNAKKHEDLLGHLVIALAPHTSAAILGRIIGFSDTMGFLAHPIYHAAQRRDLDGDESCVILLMDALLNFSRKYLPAHRGSTQDAPLVLTTQLIPTEVDDMVFDMDIVWKYPLEFYEACLSYKKPWDITIAQVNDRLKDEDPYKGYGFTHDTANLNRGVLCSAYKTLPSMKDKLHGQMKIASKLRAVDEADVARLVIEKHFLKDIKGNLRKFSTQQFRCVNCNEKYRRPPLIGKCTSCGGKIIFTISEGSVIKYFEPSLELGEKYNVPPYLKQTLELTKRRIEGVFGREKEKQSALEDWFC